MFFSAISALSVLAIGASAAIHNVQVGGPNGTLVFTPEAISANVGDQVVFHFNPKNHTVTQSSFADPCSKQDGGFNSGFMPVAANSTQAPPTYTVTVNDTKPIWVYCAQAKGLPTSHCGQGMIFAVNCPAPPSTNSFDAFKAKALAIGAQLKAAAASSSAAATEAYGSMSSAYGNTYGSATGAYGNSYGSSTSDSAAEASSTAEASASVDYSMYPGTSTYTAAYGDATIPPPPTVVSMTETIEMDSMTYTTTYASYPNSPNPTPNAEPAVINVQVGADKQLMFNPPHVSAKIGDIISFTFVGANHTVTQSSFPDPCRRPTDNTTGAPTGFDSGFQFVGTSSNFLTVNMTVNTTMPTWFYCKQKATTSHCGAGMVFSVNSDESGPRNFAAFQALAEKLNATSSLDTVTNSTGASASASGSGSAASASASAAGNGAGSTSASVVVALGAAVFAVAALL